MEFPVTVESQEAFDRLVKDRIARAEAKAAEPFADYDDLKAKAAAADAAIEAANQATAEAVARAEAAEGKVGEFETKAQVDTWRTEVATATGVPADALRGSTKEEFEAHAATLKPLLTALKGPVIPTQGDEPDKPAESDNAAFVAGLFGAGD